VKINQLLLVRYVYTVYIYSIIKSETMKTTVYISDFEDFPGLQEACRFFDNHIIQRATNFIVFNDFNPYEKAYAWGGYYNDAIRFAEENGFNVVTVKLLLDYLRANPVDLLNTMISKTSWPEGHINRTL